MATAQIPKAAVDKSAAGYQVRGSLIRMLVVVGRDTMGSGRTRITCIPLPIALAFNTVCCFCLAFEGPTTGSVTQSTFTLSQATAAVHCMPSGMRAHHV